VLNQVGLSEIRSLIAMAAARQKAWIWVEARAIKKRRGEYNSRSRRAVRGR